MELSLIKMIRVDFLSHPHLVTPTFSVIIKIFEKITRQATPPERLNSLVKICYASIIEFHRGTSSMPKTVRQSSSSNSCWIILNLKSLIQISWDWNAQNINLFRIIGPGPVLLLTSFSSNPGKAFALKGNLSLWCSDPSWDSQLTSGSINIGWESCH